MISRSGRYAFVAFVLLALPVPVRAQSSIGFIGGATIDPEQVYGGVYWQSPDLGGRVRIRPGIDGGMGDGLWLASINIDLVVSFPLGQSPWSLVQGGGPTIVIATLRDVDSSPRELHAGASYVFGFAHRDGFYTEFRVGGGDFVPNLKMGVGWTITLK